MEKSLGGMNRIEKSLAGMIRVEKSFAGVNCVEKSRLSKMEIYGNIDISKGRSI